VRTAKYILLTFWKEMLFYSVQIMYQRWNGYTGTSLYESDSLTVWNTLFTSLPVMLPGIFEQDLAAETLLAVPELYGYGQQSRGFNMRMYALWMLFAAFESQVIWWLTYWLFGIVPITDDQSLFAIGDLAFSVCVVFINVKLL
jgi:phospholipid-translocating ATPase